MAEKGNYSYGGNRPRQTYVGQEYDNDSKLGTNYRNDVVNSRYRNGTLTNQNTGNGNGNGNGNGGSGKVSPNYARMLAAYQRAYKAQRNSALSSAKATVQNLLNTYQTNLNTLNQNRESNTNQSELDRYKAMKSLRENQANRGALDSGAGRQEVLNQSNQYSKALQSINQDYNNNLTSLNNGLSGDINDTVNNYQSQVADMNSGMMSQLADAYGNGYNGKKKYTIGDGGINDYVASLRSQYEK